MHPLAPQAVSLSHPSPRTQRTSALLAAPSPTSPLGRLLTFTRRAPLAAAKACRRLGLERESLVALLEEARQRGLELALVHDHVVRRPAPDPARVPVLAPTIPRTRFVVGVVSDTHLGSLYCLRRELADFVHYAYRRGARHILHAGDVLDGCYPHGLYELSHSGLEAQTQDLFATLPQLDGLSYHAIGGNHDDTFSASAGLDAGFFVEQYFRSHGREDLHHHGRRSAFVKLGGAVVHLWHPRGACGKAVEPRVREKIQSYAPGQRPDVLLVGHWHRYVHMQARGVEGIACPTFQGASSAFSRSLVGEPALGGLLLSWTLSSHGAMRGFRLERRRYEEPHQVHELEGGEGPPPEPSCPPTEKASTKRQGAR